MSTLENAFLAAILALALVASIAAIGGGARTIATSSAGTLCDSVVFNCTTGLVRPEWCALQPPQATCHKS